MQASVNRMLALKSTAQQMQHAARETKLMRDLTKTMGRRTMQPEAMATTAAEFARAKDEHDMVAEVVQDSLDAAGEYGEDGSRRSIADVVDAQTLQEVREFKKALKAAAGKK